VGFWGDWSMMDKEYQNRIARDLERVYDIIVFESISTYKLVERRELHGIFVRVFEELDPVEREIVLGSCLYGRTSGELRRELGLKVGVTAIRLRKSKALRKIRESLRKQGVSRDYLRAS